jgi:N-acetylmuramoyl-L-alanine amidase
MAMVLLVAGGCRTVPGREGAVGRSASTAGGQAPPTEAPTTTTTSTTLPIVEAGGPAAAVVSPSGVVMPVISRGPGAWIVRTPCNATATLTRGTPVTSATIVLDPGHGGRFDPGAMSPSGLLESVVNLEVSRHAAVALQAAGVSVLMTRTGDYDLDLSPRSEIARAVAPKAFVSVHHNAEPDGPRAGPGSETYYQIASPDSKRLAGLLYEEVVKALSAYNVAWVADTDAGAKYRRGQNGDYYAVLRQPGKVVSVLTEAAFITNPPEADLLARPDVQRVEGEALARGILRWLTTADPGSGYSEPYPRTEPPPSTGPPGPPCHDPQL